MYDVFDECNSKLISEAGLRVRVEVCLDVVEISFALAAFPLFIGSGQEADPPQALTRSVLHHPSLKPLMHQSPRGNM